MPAGIADAEGRIPLKLLVLELGLGKPENEVGLIALVSVLLDALAHSYLKILLLEVVENVVLLYLGGIEIDVAACDISIALFKKGGYHIDKLVDAVGGGLDDVGGSDVECLAIGKKGIGIELCDLKDGLVLTLSALEHLILSGITVAGKVTYVGYIHNSGYVIANVTQIFLKHVLHSVGAEITDVRKVIYGRSAGVYGNLTRLSGNEKLLGS